MWGAIALSPLGVQHTEKSAHFPSGKLETQPLGAIQEKGVGSIKKMFIDDIETIELLLAHALPEGIANLAIPVLVFAGMFLVDWKLALLVLGSLPLGIVAMTAMYRIGMKDMGNYYVAARKMNNTIVEYINGMEVVRVHRDVESYYRFEGDVKSYRDFTLAWYKACWPWMALLTAFCPAWRCLPSHRAYLVIQGYSTLPDLALVLCMSFGVGAPLLRALSFMAPAQINTRSKASSRCSQPHRCSSPRRRLRQGPFGEFEASGSLTRTPRCSTAYRFRSPRAA